MSARTSCEDEIEPDRKQISIFLDVVFGYCEGLIPVRNFPEKGQDPLGPTSPCWLETGPNAYATIADIAQTAARHRTALYVIPGTVAARGQAGAQHVLQMQAVVVDIDQGDIEAKLAHLVRYLGQPTLIVESGGATEEGRAKLHVWWKLTEAATGPDLQRICQLRDTIAGKVGADRHFASAHQPIRVAGSVYHKHGASRLVLIREHLPLKYDLGEFADAVAEMPALQSPREAERRRVDHEGERDAAGCQENGQPDRSPRSVEYLLERIRTGERWHDNVLRLTGHWISRGWTDAEILLASEALTLPGFTIAQTRQEVGLMIQGGRRKWNISPPQPEITERPTAALPLLPNFLADLDIGALPPRQRVLGRSLVRGYISLLVAPPGVGKTTFASQRAVAVASGRDLTGEPVAEPTRAWVYNVEDDTDELARRLAAVLERWSIPFSDVRGRLALNSGSDRPLLFARADRNGSIIRQPDVDRCIEVIRENGIGLFVVDPFVETHEVNENANDQIKVVAGMFREIARAGNCAVQLVHHTAKPPQGASGAVAGNMNAARGASALVGVARVVETLFPMSPLDATNNGVPEDERHLYVRLDGAKANLGLASSAPTWFRRGGVVLANGDEVGVLVPCALGQPSAGRSPEQMSAILKDIDARWTAGNPYSPAPQSSRYAVPAMMKRSSLTKKQARDLLRTWIEDGVLATQVFDRHSKQTGLRVVNWPD